MKPTPTQSGTRYIIEVYKFLSKKRYSIIEYLIMTFVSGCVYALLIKIFVQ